MRKMGESLRNDMDLKPIFDKLGHKLEEIRVRALDNLLSKLHHGVLAEVDLVQEKTLLIRLLEWFNFPSCPRQKETLGLLLKLSKVPDIYGKSKSILYLQMPWQQMSPGHQQHSSAAGLLVDIGGVEFLTQLRSNASTVLQPGIDSILDNLFHLPTLQPAPQQPQQCSFQPHPQPVGHDTANWVEQAAAHAEAGLLSTSVLQDSVAASSEAHTVTAPTPLLGYFNATEPAEATAVQQPPTAMAECFKFSTFPWIGLTSTDSQVLASTDGSLRSRDKSLVLSACQFLTDVVFQDFPAEVFVQRPAIVQSLLRLVDVDASIGADISRQAVATLNTLVRCLHARIQYYQDPALYTPKQEFVCLSTQSSSSGTSLTSHSLGSSDTRPSVIGRGEPRHHGDGQDHENPSPTPSSAGSGYLQTNSDERQLPVPETEDVQALQFQQWTVVQFCTAVLHRVSGTLCGVNQALLMAVLELLEQGLRLTLEAVYQETLYQDTSMPAREMVEKLVEVMETLGDALCFHHHGNLAASTPAAEQKLHRVAFIGIGAYFSRFVQLMVPVEQCTAVIPEAALGVVCLLCEDQGLYHAMPAIRETLMPYFTQLDEGEFEAYTHAQEVATSMEHTCQFLLCSQDKISDNLLELVSHAELSLKSLPYHLNMELVNGIIGLTSQVCSKTSPNPLAVARCGKALLTLLAHPADQIRLQAYEACLSTIKEALSVGEVAIPASTAHLAANFIITEQVLFEIICFGMTDDNTKIQKNAADILNYLLQSQLLLPPSRWQNLLETVTPLLPLLQAFAGLEEDLGRSLLEMLATDNTDAVGGLPQLERFRGTLRLMFSHDARLRAEAVGKLTFFLAHEEESLHKLPLFSELNVTHLTNLFIIESPRQLEDGEPSRSVFQEEGVKKVFDIFSSLGLEVAVRKSAVEQLAIMVQDKSLQLYFLQLGAADSALDILQTAVRKPESDQPSLLSLVPSLLTILRHLVQHNYGLRHKLAHKKEVYFTVLRCSLLHTINLPVQYEAAMLICLLVFDEMASINTGSTDLTSSSAAFCLPRFIAQRYRLPFRCPTHLSVSPHRVQPLPEYDPLAHGTLAELLRLCWQQEWCGGLQGMLELCRQPPAQAAKDEHSYSNELKLRSTDRLVMLTSHLPTGLQNCVYALQNATNHQQVSAAVQDMMFYLVAGRHHLAADLLQETLWLEALARFFQVMPHTSADERLLTHILQLFCTVLSAEQAPSAALIMWLSDSLHNQQGALCNLISRPDSPPEGLSEDALLVRRNLGPILQKFLQLYVGRMPYTVLTKRSTEYSIPGELVKSMLQRLSVPDAAHFYNLASLESTLHTLMHITARPGWSLGGAEDSSLTLCQQLLHGLLQVVSAFHIGRGATSISYMGRGVTRSATLCLRHVAYEMANHLHTQDWPRSWLYSRQATPNFVGESGLHWLTPLWTYRDTEVRAAGLGIAVALASTEAGRITMTTQCQHITGGVWGAAFSVLLDHAECSLVREQAALLLVNLTSQPMPLGTVETAASVWQGPIVRNEETQVSLVGLSALLALLEHSRFYAEMAQILATYYPQSAIHPISVASPTPISTATASQTTTTTSGTGSSRASPLQASMFTPDASTVQMTSTPANEGLDQRPGVEGGAQQQTAQGVLHNQSVSSSSSAVAVTEYASVTTPCLVCSMCELLRNLLQLAPTETLQALLQHDILAQLTRLIDADLLQAYLSAGDEQAGTLALKDLLRLHSSVLQLLQLCCIQDAAQCRRVLLDHALLTHVTALLGVSFQNDSDNGVLCAGLWQSTFSFLTAVLQTGGKEALIAATPALTKNWHCITDRCVKVLGNSGWEESRLWLAVLHFLAVLLCGEVQLQQAAGSNRRPQDSSLTAMLDGNQDSDDTLSSGGRLSKALLKTYDAVSMRPVDHGAGAKVPMFMAYKALLAASSVARTSALEGGLVESVCEQLRRLHVQLSMDALEVAHSQQNKAKEHPVVEEVMLCLELLRNAMYQQQEVKLAGYECGLSSILHQLWAWGQIEPQLLTSILNLLATYTARCPQACSSLSSTSAVAMFDRSNVKASQTSGSLVHCLIRLAQRQAGPVPTLKLTFAVLATLALSQECRGIFCKCNFLQDFSSVNPGKSKKSREQRVREGLWLDLLLNLSFSTDGQNIILKTTDAVSLLLELGSGSNEQHSQRVALILRNLCLHTANKAKLLANDAVVDYFLCGVGGENEQIQVLTSSALLALLYNSQKAKVTLKSNMVVRRLQEAYNQLVHQPHPSSIQESSAQNLQDILTLLAA